MRVIDADGHVEENPITFSDKYFDPAFRAHRPVVVPGSEDGSGLLDDRRAAVSAPRRPRLQQSRHADKLSRQTGAPRPAQSPIRWAAWS